MTSLELTARAQPVAGTPIVSAAHRLALYRFQPASAGDSATPPGKMADTAMILRIVASLIGGSA
jgi:hypothetical protein